jgi:flagellar FliJ protein
MAFYFSLQTILHLRQSLEHQQELRLRTANQQVAKVRHLLEQLDQRIGGARKQQQESLMAGTTSSELRFSLAVETSLQRLRSDLLRELARLETLRDQQQQLLQQARREREVLDSLRNRKLQQYVLDTLRREQRSLDEIFVMRQAYSRRG